MCVCVCVSRPAEKNLRDAEGSVARGRSSVGRSVGVVSPAKVPLAAAAGVV